MKTTNWMITCWITLTAPGEDKPTESAASFEVALEKPTEMLDWATLQHMLAQYTATLRPSTVLSAVPMGVFPMRPSTVDPNLAKKAAEAEPEAEAEAEAGVPQECSDEGPTPIEPLNEP